MSQTKPAERLPVGPNFPGGLLTYQTGTWRVFRPVLSEEKCSGCLLCWVFCPEGTISRLDKEIRINYDYCKGCGICAEECPRSAISMVKEGSSDV
ncbi:hypothetical protein SY88_15420 [Clostridiales bacterium PH28_bin88]|nr:hypothetical protein SY88_15420 [Clostridiales bacterium PH28_bin88]